MIHLFWQDCLYIKQKYFYDRMTFLKSRKLKLKFICYNGLSYFVLRYNVEQYLLKH